MAGEIQKIDSNLTGLAYAEEKCIGELPFIANGDATDPVWTPLEPNEYDDFGGQLTTVARNPINPSRQRKKGVVTDLDASGGFSTDLTLTNLQDLSQGFFFADLRRKAEFGGAGEITNVDGTNEDFEAASGLDVFAAGDIVLASGFVDNNGLKNVTAAVAGSLTVAEDLIDEVPAAGAKLVKVGALTPADDLAVDVAGTFPALTSTVFDFTTLGLIPGEWVYVGGDAAANTFPTNAANNGFKRVRSVASNRLTFDKSDAAMVAETLSGGEQIQIWLPRTIKNEVGGNIVRRTYQLERTLGRPQEASPNDQSEYLVGAVPNELEISIPQADKITTSLSFVATNNEQRTDVEGLKGGTRVPLIESDAINTSSDFSRIKLARVVDGDAAPTPLFAFATEMTLTINNNVSPNKAIGVLGAFEVTAGTFTVSGELTVYLADIAAVSAVRNNEDITFDLAIAKDNAGIVMDVPLIALGDGRANVEQDAAITLPLTMDAATAAKIDQNLDYTLMFCYFDYLPTVAQT